MLAGLGNFRILECRFSVNRFNRLSKKASANLYINHILVLIYHSSVMSRLMYCPGITLPELLMDELCDRPIRSVFLFKMEKFDST